MILVSVYELTNVPVFNNPDSTVNEHAMTHLANRINAPNDFRFAIVHEDDDNGQKLMETV